MNDLFELIKQGEKGLQELPPPHAWQKLEARLERKRRKKRKGIRFLQISAAVALVLLLLLLAFFALHTLQR